MRIIGTLACVLLIALQAANSPERLEVPGEKRLKNLKQLTFGGENAEAYFSFDGKMLIFQSTRGEHKCDQIYVMRVDGSDQRMVSTGKGRCTCGYFFPDGKRIIFSSTHLEGPDCPPRPSYERGYVWPIYRSYDIFSANLDGSDLRRLTWTDGYDAEATISPDGTKIVFTSVRDGDLEIYTMDPDGGQIKRLTHALGYDGGAFFSYDGKMIVYRGYHPKDEAEIKRYRELLGQGLVEPKRLDIFVMNEDGSNKRQLTANGAANFAPCFHPNGRQILFASNMHDPRGRNFDLYLINIDGSGLERVTYHEEFDGFPMFSPDGKKLVFASNRNAKQRGETNIFIADWAQ